VRLHRNLKIIVSRLTRFANVTVQIDDAICEVEFNVLALSFLLKCRTPFCCQGWNVIMVN
jgi:hypothetical protein